MNQLYGKSSTPFIFVDLEFFSDKPRVWNPTIFIPSLHSPTFSAMSQPISNDASLLSAAPAAAEMTDSTAPALDFDPSSTPVVVYNISDLSSEYSVVVDDSVVDDSGVDNSVADTSLFASDAGEVDGVDEASAEAKGPEPPSMFLPPIFP
jgi:hypothetical protein